MICLSLQDINMSGSMDWHTVVFVVVETCNSSSRA